MIRFIKRLFGLLMLLAIGLGLFLWFGPRQTVDPDILKAAFTGSEENAVQEFLNSDKAFSDIKMGQEKQIIWAGAEGAKTDVSIVYVHGFSASLQEIRPVPDLVAAEFGANLVYARLTGHGQPGTSMGNVNVNDWIEDLGKAVRTGAAVGQKTVVIGTSTGGTLITSALADETVAANIAGIVYVAPNFALKNPTAKLGGFPMFDVWGPMIAGETRSWEPKNEAHAEFWTTSYPTKSIVPMMALINYVAKIDVSKTDIPALFVYSDDDQVVDSATTKDIADKWGGVKSRYAPTLTVQDDPMAHVIAGDIMSPNQTKPITDAIVGWMRGLE